MSTPRLDGSQEYHRHPGGLVHPGRALGCTAGSGGQPVVIFDPASLDAHDDAVRHDHEHHPAGASSRPLYDPEQWTWVLLDAPEPGQDPTTCAVLAGWDASGTFRRYASPETLVAALRHALETTL